MTKDVSEFKIMEFSDYLEKFNKALLNSTFSRRLEFLDNFFMEKTRAGLDIGTHSVKLVEVTDTNKGCTLVALGHRDIPGGGPANETQKDEVIVQAIRDLWLKNKVKARWVSLVISDPRIYLRHINIPIVPEEELIRAVRWQAEKYVPFPIDEAVVDFQILSSKIKGSENQMEIVIVAVAKKIIDHYLALLKEVKLTPTIIDVAPFAVAKAFSYNYDIGEGEIVPVIDMGGQNTAILVLKKGTLQLVRKIDIAGQHLTDAIAKDRNVTKEKAEETKRAFSWPLDLGDSSQNETILSAMEPVFAEWIDEVNRSLAYCEKELIDEKIRRVFLCGGCASLKGIDEFLSERLSLTVKIASPFSHLKIPEKIMKNVDVGGMAPLFMAALGEVI